MSNDKKKSRLHIHIGGLVILIIILLILFKVDIMSKIQSPQFQKNISYVEEQVKTFWQKYVSIPIKSKTGDLFINFTNKGLQQIQDNFSKNILKTPSTEDIEKASN